MCVRRVLLLVGLVSIAAIGACAKVSVLHVTKSATPGGRLNEEGVFYALPKTVAKVQVKIEKTEKTASPYMLFAPIFAPGATALCDEPDKCRKTTDSTAFALEKATTFTTAGEPDPEQVYLVRISGGGTLDQAMSMAWTDAGVATAAAASITNRTIDVAVAGVKLASSLGSKAFLGAVDVTDSKTSNTCPGEDPAKSPSVDPKLAAVNKWVIPELEKISDADAASLLIANYCDMKADVRKQYKEADDKPLLTRAVASYELRVLPYVKSRFSMLTGPSNVLDPGALVDRLDKIIDAELKNLFLGTSEKSSWEPTFEVRDIKLDPLRVELLQIDKDNGPCPKADLTVDSKPMPAKFPTKGLVCTATHPSAELKVILFPAVGQLFDTVQGGVNAPAAGEERSFRYRIPAQVRATLLFDKKDTDYGSGIFAVAQLGHVVSLPARRASKTLSYDLAFIEQTGGLRSFKIGSTGVVDAATLQGISEAGGTVLDARNTKRDKDDAAVKEAAKAAATAADELTIVTRQHTLLKLKHEICEIQKQYGLACTVQP